MGTKGPTEPIGAENHATEPLLRVLTVYFPRAVAATPNTIERFHEEFRRRVEDEVRYANISIIEGTGARQLGIGMATARIVEALLRDEHLVMPVGSFNPTYGTTLSLPSVLGRSGVTRILEPEMSEDERQALERSAARLREAVERLEV